jgi:hypothetical protein
MFPQLLVRNSSRFCDAEITAFSPMKSVGFYIVEFEL